MFLHRRVLLVQEQVVDRRPDCAEPDLVTCGVSQAAHQHLLDHLHVLAVLVAKHSGHGSVNVCKIVKSNFLSALKLKFLGLIKCVTMPNWIRITSISCEHSTTGHALFSDPPPVQ